MDKNIVTVHEEKVSKKKGLHKIKKKAAVKVVYISNPMKIETTASEFRALVQQLTGRHSAMPPESPDSGGHRGCTRDVKQEQHEHDGVAEDELLVLSGTGVESGSDVGTGSDLYDVEDVFVPQMEEIYGNLPARFWYESTHLLDHQLKRLDTQL